MVQVPVGNREDIADKCGGVENAKRCSLVLSPENFYADLEAVNLLSFAYQIASGMVNQYFYFKCVANYSKNLLCAINLFYNVFPYIYIYIILFWQM